MTPLFVLVHSPSVGPATWQPVASHLRAAGHDVVVPSLLNVGTGEPPYWPRAVEAVRDALADRHGMTDRDALAHRHALTDRPLVLVAHSNAGLFVPVIRAGLPHPLAGSVFVDAALPATAGHTPVVAADRLARLRTMADVEGRLPRWTDWFDESDVAPMFPDPATRERVTREQPRLPVTYYEQSVPVPPGWHDHPSAYVRFSPPYAGLAATAAERGWPVFELPGAHLHQIVDPAGVAAILLEWAAAR